VECTVLQRNLVFYPTNPREPKGRDASVRAFRICIANMYEGGEYDDPSTFLRKGLLEILGLVSLLNSRSTK